MSFAAWLRSLWRPAAVAIPPAPADMLGAANTPMTWPDARGGPVSDATLRLIAGFEGFGDVAAVRAGRVKSKGHPYLCPRGVPTIGYGATFYPETGARVTMDDPPINEAQGVMMLRHHAAQFAADVDRVVKVPLSPGERGALISFAFNLGPGNLAGSTLLRKLNANDRKGAAAEFAKWNKAGTSIMEGLTRRRAAEAAMFLGE